MFRVKTVTVGLLLILFLDKAYAVTLTATVDKTEATLQDQILLTLSVAGTQSTEKPKLPSTKAFDVISRGSSTRMQIINGQVSSSVDYNYLLLPKKTGTFEIGPATITHQGKTIASTTITLKIGSANSQPQSKKDLFITTSISTTTPYVNEQILYTFRLYRRVKIANARLENPSFEGFRVEPLGEERQYETVVNGRTYVVTEIKQVLFPTREGRIEIGSAKIQCDVAVRTRRRRGFFDDSFFGFSQTEPRVLRAPSLELNVRPLPPEGKTPLFSNLVGTFNLETSVSKKQLEVGDTTTLAITIRGTGNIKDAQAPEFPSLPSFKVYDDKPTLTIDTSGDAYGGTLTIKKALVPLEEGTLKVPLLTFTYFNPESGRYELCKSSPLTLQVRPSRDKEKLHLVEALGTITSKEEIKILGRDILPLKTSLSALRPYDINPWRWNYLIFFLFPIAGYAGAVVITSRKKRWEEDLSYARRKSAMRELNKRIAEVKKQTPGKDASEFYRLTSKALKSFFGDKLNITGSALTPLEIEHQLHRCSVQKERIEQIKEVLNTLEAGQFAFQQHSKKEKEDLLRKVKTLATFFDKRIKQ
jgi:hypothetical protein